MTSVPKMECGHRATGTARVGAVDVWCCVKCLLLAGAGLEGLTPVEREGAR